VDPDDFGDFGKLARLAHDLAIWFETHNVACPICGAYHEPHDLDCPVGVAVEWRKLNASC
jgi:hypothetical protein